jgi:hypothetical protein
MPPKYEKCLPKLSNNDVTNVEEHMRNFLALFQLNLVDVNVEDLVMKLFSATLHDATRRWYDSLLDKSIKTMDQLEETFLKRWSVKEDLNMLLTRLNKIIKYENEIVKYFHAKFEKLLQQIPKSHHPGGDCNLFLYIKDYLGNFGFFLGDEGLNTIQEAQEMATKIEASLSSCKVEPFYAPRDRTYTKPMVVNNTEPTQDISGALA